MSIADNLLSELRTWRRQPAGELVTRLGISRPSLMRAIDALGNQVVTRGRARRTSYAARRDVKGSNQNIPFYRIDTHGGVHDAGFIEPIYPIGSAATFNEPFAWPLVDDMRDGWFGGLPYPLTDMRPQGFLGRNFAHQFAPLLQVDVDITRWNDDDILHVLSVLGWDLPGNYIVGEPALRRFLDEKQTRHHFLTADELPQIYPQRALEALNFGVVGSSAAGEFPKFTARRMGDKPMHVIVKFSGADKSPQEQRWADLLICEHVALATIADTLHISASTSQVFEFEGRTFLEIERFDRHGEIGRSGVCSWHEINAAVVGGASSWTEGAQALQNMALITESTAQQIALLAQFGKLIANTDMHDGNLAFLPDMTLAPAYDMLPMLYAPQAGVEITERQFTPALPLPKEQLTWQIAAKAAQLFWQRAENDHRISATFRKICATNAQHIGYLLTL